MNMEWIKVTDRMPEEEEYFVSGNNYIDGKDRRWTESKQVLCVRQSGDYIVDCTRDGKFMSEKYKNCYGYPNYIVAWMSRPEFKFEF